MMQVKLATAALLGLTAVSALAQAPSMNMTAGVPLATVPGYTPGVPVSDSAANITPANTRSAIAPALPTPRVGDDADTRAYLQAAHAALVNGRTGEAQESLERAETRLLTRETTPDMAFIPDTSPRISRIKEALVALGNGRRAHALQALNLALAD